MNSIFENLNIKYDSENNKFYDLTQEVIRFSLPLIPEKYLRKKEVVALTLEELISKVNEIEKDLESLIRGCKK